MRNFWKSLLAVAVLAFASPADAVVNRSTINPGIPAQSATISSLPLRQNFTAAYNDVNNIYSIINNYGSIVSQNANAVAITGGTINGTTIGNAFPAPGTFSTLTTTAVGSFGSINVTGTAAPLNGLYLEDGFQIPTMTANGDQVMQFVGIGGNAVDFFQVQPANTGNPAQIQIGAEGSDANISIAYYTSGTGKHQFYTHDNGLQFEIIDTAGTVVNHATLTGAITNYFPTLATTGSDAQVPLAVAADGFALSYFNDNGLILGGDEKFQLSGGPAGTNKSYLEVANSSLSNRAYFDVFNASFSANGPTIVLNKARNYVNSLVSNGDEIGSVIWQGADGTNLKAAAQIEVTATGTPASGIIPGNMVISTTNTSGTLTTAATIDNAQRVTVGGTNQATASAGNTTLEVNGVTSAKSSLGVLAWSSSTPLFELGRSNGSGIGTQGAVGSSDTLGQFTFSGSDGTGLQTSSVLQGISNGTVGTGHVPGAMRFSTANSSGTLTQALFLDSSQNAFPAGGLFADTGSSTAPGGSVEFQVGPTGTTGTIRHVINGSGSYLGIYSSVYSLYYGIAVQCPGPGGTSTLCGYFNGLAISGSSNNTGNNIFGVLTSTQTGAGVGNTAFTINDQNGVSTFNNVIDDGHGGQKIVAEGSGGGTKFTVTGCSAASTVGGPTAGQFASGSTSTCTFVITMNGATGYTATNGWSCFASDITHALDLTQSATSATTCSVTGAVTSGDTIIFQAKFY